MQPVQRRFPLFWVGKVSYSPGCVPEIAGHQPAHPRTQSFRWHIFRHQLEEIQREVAMVQNQWYHFGIGAPPILVHFSGDWDVHWGYEVLTHGQVSQSPWLWGVCELHAEHCVYEGEHVVGFSRILVGVCSLQTTMKKATWRIVAGCQFKKACAQDWFDNYLRITYGEDSLRYSMICQARVVHWRLGSRLADLQWCICPLRLRGGGISVRSTTNKGPVFCHGSGGLGMNMSSTSQQGLCKSPRLGSSRAPQKGATKGASADQKALQSHYMIDNGLAEAANFLFQKGEAEMRQGQARVEELSLGGCIALYRFACTFCKWRH